MNHVGIKHLVRAERCLEEALTHITNFEAHSEIKTAYEIIKTAGDRLAPDIIDEMRRGQIDVMM